MNKVDILDELIDQDAKIEQLIDENYKLKQAIITAVDESSRLPLTWLKLKHIHKVLSEVLTEPK